MEHTNDKLTLCSLRSQAGEGGAGGVPVSRGLGVASGRERGKPENYIP
jgi:hypothetical protein